MVYFVLSYFNVVMHNLPGSGPIAAWNLFNLIK